ncbi:LysR family transcriptional regulator [Marinobacterium arenosum]|uniref:LysR family transcriptional regulator n=1 Tax=Marinobacterium arenosum TaxID=2862496 RepID=UPI001C946A5F|nr:LysR family transcriptional regulator [Marinobacterium arenosum]MBY4678092.1 LysR family transcriptional regulator [Marinobacterium arenosum]
MELSRINLNLLLSLYQLLRTRSVTAAAAAQHVTQPAMSRNLAQLRQILADPLLVRVGNEMQRTPRGEALWQQLPELLNQLESLLVPSEFQPAGYRGQFNIAVTDYITQQILPPLIAALQDDAPGIDLHFHLWQPGMLEDLRQGRLDLAACILDEVPDDIYGRQVGKDGFSCLLSPDHPLAGQPLLLEDYIEQSHLAVSAGGDKNRTVDEALARLGLSRRVKLTVPFIHSALAITARSRYLLTLPNHIVHNLQAQYGLVRQPLPAELQIDPTRYYLIWHRRQHQDPAHRYLRERLFAALNDSQAEPIEVPLARSS